MKRLEAMLRLQQELNDTTNGTGWEDGVTHQGKPIDWRRCIWLEAAELVESYPWKHWKDIAADPDYDNIKIETVDIWHFVMSEALRIHALERAGDIALLAERMSRSEAYRALDQGYGKVPNDPYEQIAQVERLVALLFMEAPIEEWTAQFYRVAQQSGLTLDALYRLYVGKNILNRFRQDHGYKEGTYRKKWRGVEDNIVMQAILEHHPDLSPDALYAQLKQNYAEENLEKASLK
jgi:hypothetical protein